MRIDEVLDGAADLIAKPGGWVQHTYAVDAYGRPTNRFGADACSFCLTGAMDRIGYNVSTYYQAEAVDYLNHLLGNRSSVGFNDAPGRTQAEVVDFLRESAKKYREENAIKS